MRDHVILVLLFKLKAASAVRKNLKHLVEAKERTVVKFVEPYLIVESITVRESVTKVHVDLAQEIQRG